jgi:RHS repeat-associated protein
MLENRYKFNKGTELNTDLGLDWYETPHRGYDAQLGRFWQVDAMSDMNWTTSVYVFASNNPLLRNDPTGLKDTIINIHLSMVEVVGKAKGKKKSQGPAPFWWPSYGGQSGKEINEQTNNQLSRLRDGKPLLPGGDHAFYHRAHKAQQDWRTMNYATLGYFAATAAVVGVSIYAPIAYPLVAKALTSELSLIRSATLNATQLNLIRNFGANLGLQYAFNGREADYLDAAAGAYNPLAGLIGVQFDLKPGLGQLIPHLTSDNSYRVTAKWNQNLFLTGLQMTFEGMLRTNLPTASYFIGVMDALGGKMIDNSFPDEKK